MSNEKQKLVIKPDDVIDVPESPFKGNGQMITRSRELEVYLANDYHAACKVAIRLRDNLTINGNTSNASANAEHAPVPQHDPPSQIGKPGWGAQLPNPALSVQKMQSSNRSEEFTTKMGYLMRDVALKFREIAETGKLINAASRKVAAGIAELKAGTNQIRSEVLKLTSADETS